MVQAQEGPASSTAQGQSTAVSCKAGQSGGRRISDREDHHLQGDMSLLHSCRAQFNHHTGAFVSPSLSDYIPAVGPGSANHGYHRGSSSISERSKYDKPLPRTRQCLWSTILRRSTHVQRKYQFPRAAVISYGTEQWEQRVSLQARAKQASTRGVVIMHSLHAELLKPRLSTPSCCFRPKCDGVESPRRESRRMLAQLAIEECPQPSTMSPAQTRQ